MSHGVQIGHRGGSLYLYSVNEWRISYFKNHCRIIILCSIYMYLVVVDLSFERGFLASLKRLLQLSPRLV